MNLRADLTPPLGYPGGPCHVVRRIRDEVRDPRLREELIREVEEGDDLTNPEAAKVYEVESERGPGPIRQILVGPHAEYRMDLRHVTIPQVRTALQSFLKAFYDSKSRQGWEYDRWSRDLARGEGVNWTDPRLDLTVVFTGVGDGRVKIITVYWQNDTKPRPLRPGECEIVAGYSPPASELPGQQTFVKNPDGSEPSERDESKERDTEKERALPSPPWSRSKPMPGRPVYNVPGESGSSGDGKNLHEDKVRTKGTPGGDEHPVVDNSTGYKQRRPDVSAAMVGPPFPGSKRQHEQRGDAKRYYKNYYRRNKSTIRHRMTKWYITHRSQGRYRRDMERRRDFPDKFDRRPGGGQRDPAVRSQEWRDEQKQQQAERGDAGKRKTAHFDPFFFVLPDGRHGELDAVTEDGWAQVWFEGRGFSWPLEDFLSKVGVPDEAEQERLFEHLDSVFEFTEEPMTLEAAWGPTLVADFLYEKRPPESDPEQHFDRGSEPRKRPPRWPEGKPAEEEPAYEVTDNPGSAKVIPTNRDFVNNTSGMDRVAVRISEITEGCSPDLLRRSKNIAVRLRRVDTKNHLWLFEVPGSKGTYRVRVKAVPKGNVSDVGKMDVLVSCSCPYWQWQGPEHWASTRGYLYGKPRGMATAPDVKDPDGTHLACKHVLAVLRQVSGYAGAPGRSRGRFASEIGILAALLRANGEVWVVPEDGLVAASVAWRYLERMGAER